MKKILIIEDEPAYAGLLRGKLEEIGYSVTEAINGELGLEKAKIEHPDLILLDIRMPLMDGITMLSQLRKNEASKKTIVIMLTNLEPDDKILGAVLNDQPAYYFVKSDITLDDLLNKVNQLLAD